MGLSNLTGGLSMNNGGLTMLNQALSMDTGGLTMLGGSFNPNSIAGLQAWALTTAPYYYASNPVGGYQVLDSKESFGSYRAPRKGRAYLFDGVDDQGDMTSAVALTGDFTLCCWFNETSTGNMIWGSKTDNLNYVRPVASASMAGLFNNVAFSVALNTAYSLGTWQHVILRRTSGLVEVFMNGVKQTASTTNANTLTLSRIGNYSTIATFNFDGLMRDNRIYNVAKSDPEALAIYNQSISGNGAVDTAGLAAGYWCNEEAGTTGYDWSGNGNHLTLANITAATFHAINTGVTANAANTLGFTLSGSTVIPRNEANPTQDVTGGAIQYTGLCPHPFSISSPCLTGDGSAVYANLGSALLPATADYTLEVYYYHTTNDATIRTIVSQGAGSWSLEANASALATASAGALFAGDVTNGVAVAGCLSENAWHKITLVKSGSTHTLTCVQIANSLSFNNSGSYSPTISIASNTTLLATSAPLLLANGAVAYFSVLTGGVTTYFPLDEGAGSGGTNRDLYYVKSDGTYGVASSAIVGGTAATIWGTLCPYTQDWCVQYGGRINASGVFVPGQISGSLAADGNAKNCAAGKHGNVNSRLNMNPFSAAEFNALAAQTSYEDLPCITGDGSTVYANLDSFRGLVSIVSAYSGEAYIYLPNVTTTQNIIGGSASATNRFAVTVSAGVLSIGAYNGAWTAKSASVVVNTWYKITWSYNSGTHTMTATLNDAAMVGAITPTSSGSAAALRLLSSSSAAAFCSGRISNLSFTSAGVTTYFPLTAGSGADLAWYKSDNTTGVATTALLGTLTNVWANKNNGSIVPATKYSQRTIIPRDTKFNAVASDGDNRFLIYGTALTGANLTNVMTYIS